MTTADGREQQIIRAWPHMAGQVLLDRLQEVRRDGHVTTTGCALGCADHDTARAERCPDEPTAIAAMMLGVRWP